MNKLIGMALVIGSLCTITNASSYNVSISGSERGINGFSLSIGDYYHVPYNELVMVERSIPYDEMSVVYFLVHHSHRDARYIVGLRMRGLSWWDITLRLGLNPYTLFVVNSRYSYPPYGHHKAGKNYRLRDNDVIELVNVRFLSDYHRISVDDVIQKRRSGDRYMRIDEFYRTKNIERNRTKERDPRESYEHNYYRNDQRNVERNVERNTPQNDRGDSQRIRDQRDQDNLNRHGGNDR